MPPGSALFNRDFISGLCILIYSFNLFSLLFSIAIGLFFSIRNIQFLSFFHFPIRLRSSLRIIYTKLKWTPTLLWLLSWKVAKIRFNTQKYVTKYWQTVTFNRWNRPLIVSTWLNKKQDKKVDINKDAVNWNSVPQKFVPFKNEQFEMHIGLRTKLFEQNFSVDWGHIIIYPSNSIRDVCLQYR